MLKDLRCEKVRNRGGEPSIATFDEMTRVRCEAGEDDTHARGTRTRASIFGFFLPEQSNVATQGPDGTRLAGGGFLRVQTARVEASAPRSVNSSSFVLARGHPMVSRRLLWTLPLACYWL